MIDAGRCLSWILQKPGTIPLHWRELIGDRIYGCDDCQDVCPIIGPAGTAGDDRGRRTCRARGSMRWRCSTPTTSGSTQRYAHWYVADRDYRWVRRNALVVVGNVGEPDDTRCHQVLDRYRSGPDPILAEHAAWAHERLVLPIQMKHLLVTNDFPPKIGGIQSLLWEWWRRLPADRFAVLTSPHAGAAEFDAEQPYPIERTREPVLLPHPFMVRQVNDLARDFGADLVVLDPAVPLGLIGPSLELPYDLVLHGAEVTVPGSAPAQQAGAGATRSAGPATSSPPAGTRRPRPNTRRGVRCRSPSCRAVSMPIGSTRSSPAERAAAREHFGIPADAELIVEHLAARAAQGLRHGDPGGGPARTHEARPAARDRRRWPRQRPAAAARHRTRRAGAVPRPDPERRHAAPVRVRRHLHHALPQSVGRPRAGGLRHRVRRGRGLWDPAGRRRLGRSGRSGRSTARPGTSSTIPRTSRRSPTRSLVCSTTTTLRAEMGARSRQRVLEEFTYDVLSKRLGDTLQVFDHGDSDA